MIDLGHIDDLARRLSGLVPPGLRESREELQENFKSVLQAGLAGQNYWVYDHAPDYSWALMGLPDKSNWWIWHRNQNASQADRDRILSRVRALGFSTGRLVHTGL